MREPQYQRKLIRKINRMFPGCLVIKNDASYMQGVPDLSIFFGGRWAMLEIKASEDAPEQPNQRHYVELMNRESFAAFIYPENEQEVLDELQHAFNA